MIDDEVINNISSEDLQEGLSGTTPAEIAGLDLGLGQNKWKGLIQKSVENQVTNSV